LKHYEKLQDILLGTRFRYYSDLAAYERQPMQFVFELYQPEDKWFTFGALVDQEFDDDLETQSRTGIGRK